MIRNCGKWSDILVTRFPLRALKLKVLAKMLSIKVALLAVAHFGLELGMVFKGTMGVYRHICHFNSK